DLLQDIRKFGGLISYCPSNSHFKATQANDLVCFFDSSRKTMEYAFEIRTTLSLNDLEKIIKAFTLMYRNGHIVFFSNSDLPGERILLLLCKGLIPMIIHTDLPHRAEFSFGEPILNYF